MSSLSSTNSRPYSIDSSTTDGWNIHYVVLQTEMGTKISSLSRYQESFQCVFGFGVECGVAYSSACWVDAVGDRGCVEVDGLHRLADVDEWDCWVVVS